MCMFSIPTAEAQISLHVDSGWLIKQISSKDINELRNPWFKMKLFIIYFLMSMESMGESDIFYYSTFSFYSPFYLLLDLIGEGDGTPLQYSCLENPMDGGAW